MKILFVCLFFIGSALAFIPQETALQAKDERFITANLNDYIDYCLPYIIKFMLENGLDPMDLPDIEEGFSYKPLLITYHGRLELTNGVFKNLRSLRRAGDVKISYISKIVKISANFALDNIYFRYDYLAKIMGLGPRGGVIGEVKTASVETEFLIDFNNLEIHLQKFNIHNIGRLTVRFTGNILVDWLANILVGVITTLFKSVIMYFVERAMRKAIQDFINDINNSIAGSKQLLEQLHLNPEQMLPIIMNAKNIQI